MKITPHWRKRAQKQRILHSSDFTRNIQNVPKVPNWQRKQTPRKKIDAQEDRRARILQQDEEREGEVEHRSDERNQFAKLHRPHAAVSTDVDPGGYQWKQFASNT